MFGFSGHAANSYASRRFTEAIVLYIDGFNNPGFSGGPIIYWSLNDHIIQILGVLKGYKPESAKVIVNGVQHLAVILFKDDLLLVDQ
jgi:hypothetical protein